MECSEFRALFWAFAQSPMIPPTEDRALWLRDCFVVARVPLRLSLYTMIEAHVQNINN